MFSLLLYNFLNSVNKDAFNDNSGKTGNAKKRENGKKETENPGEARIKAEKGRAVGNPA